MKKFLIALILCFKAALILSKATPAVCPNILSKSRWGGRPATGVDYTIIPVRNVVIHHTVTPTCTNEDDCSTRLVNIQSYHMDTLKFYDIGYNFIIGGDGQVYEGAGWHKVGAHTFGWNTKSIGIGFIGDFSTVVPPAKQLDAGKKLIQCGVELGELDQQYKLFGGKSVIATESPGAELFRKIQEWKGFTRRP